VDKWSLTANTIHNRQKSPFSLLPSIEITQHNQNIRINSNRNISQDNQSATLDLKIKEAKRRGN
jgi:hypothetical protein